MSRGPECKTRLSYWFPLIEAAGLPVPKTWIIPLTEEETIGLYDWIDAKKPTCLGRITQAIGEAAEHAGVPFFLRTDFTSGKHDWQNTCYVSEIEKLERHLYGLFEYSQLADFMGLPVDAFVVRELLPTQASFHAFMGRMPITREFRFFVRDGVIEHIQPYWPPEAIEDQNPDSDNWRLQLFAMSRFYGSEMEMLSELTQKASTAVPGFWSVDWLKTSDRRWVLTDMAEGEDSYRWEPADAFEPSPSTSSPE